MRKKILPLITAAAMAISLCAGVVQASEDTGGAGTGSTAVAMIGETGYTKLADAVLHANDNTEIVMSNDTAEDITIPSGKTVTIDLNGKKLTNVSDHTITNNGTLTVKDSSEKKTGTVDSVVNGKAAVYNTAEATATLSGGTYKRSSESGTSGGANENSYYTVYNQGTMNLNQDVKVENTGTYSSCVINGGYANNAVMIIDGAEISGGVITIKNDEYGSELTIKSGTFTNSNKSNGSVLQNSATATINGGTFTGARYVIHTTPGSPSMSVEAEENGNTTITEGTFNTSDVYAACVTCNGSNRDAYKDDINVSGGTFSKAVASEFLSDDRMVIKNDEGAYSVVEYNSQYVAKCAGVYYKSINDAINAYTGTLTLQQNIDLVGNTTEDVVIPSGRKVKIELGGYKITNMSDNTITNNGTLTVKDSSEGKTGTVDNITHKKAAVHNNVGGKACLYGGNYTRSAEASTSTTDPKGNSWYNIVNYGTMEMKDIKVTSRGSFSSLVENGWYYGTQNTTRTPAVLKIESGEFSGGINTIKNDDWGELVINGGTFENMTQHAVLNWNVTEINGGTFEVSYTGSDTVYAVANGYADEAMDKGELTITGGDFNGGILINSTGDAAITAANNVAVSGGKFSADVTKYLTDTAGISAPSSDGKYTVISPDSPTSAAGTYRTKSSESGTFEQMSLFNKTFDTATNVSSISFNVNITEDGSIKSGTYKYTGADTTIAAGGTAVFGLIVTDIPDKATVTVTLAD